MNPILNNRNLADNPTPRVPICLCLDTSGSMGTVEGGNYTYTGRQFVCDGTTYDEVTGGITRLDKLKEGLQLFYDEVKADELAAAAADICIVTFDSRAECRSRFAGVEAQSVPELRSGQDTAMGEGVNLALDLLEKRKEEYRRQGIEYYQPWLVLMTDGIPNGDHAELERAKERTQTLVRNRKLTIFPIGIGEEADMSTLAQLSPATTPLHLRDLRFREFFAWLSRSVQRVSESTPGEPVVLDLEGIRGWGKL